MYKVVLIFVFILGLVFFHSCKVKRDPYIGDCKCIFDSISGQIVYTSVDQMPEFPNGLNGIIMYFVDSFHYPKQVTFQGIIQIEFIVDEKGEVVYPRIYGKEPSNYTPVEIEALRVVNTMPEWQPGKCHGKKIKVRFIIPLNLETAFKR